MRLHEGEEGEVTQTRQGQQLGLGKAGAPADDDAREEDARRSLQGVEIGLKRFRDFIQGLAVNPTRTLRSQDFLVPKRYRKEEGREGEGPSGFFPVPQGS